MAEHRDLSREPCPDRIVEDLGGAFGMGCVGGFLWHFGKGWYNSPKYEKLAGAFYSSRMRAPILGGNFAVWGGTFSTFDCTFQYLRNKDDHWNAIASGAVTGGLLALRGGWRTASRQAVIGGVLLAVIEGVMVIFSRRTATTPRDEYYESIKYEERMQAAAKQPKSSWFPFSNPAPSPSAPPSTGAASPFEDPAAAAANTLSSSSELMADPAASPPLSFSAFSSEYAPAAGETVKRRWRGFA